MRPHHYVASPHLKTAALDQALLVFCPGSGATVALTDDLQVVFSSIAAGHGDETTLCTALHASASMPADGASPGDDSEPQQLQHCLRLLLQQHLIVAVAP